MHLYQHPIQPVPTETEPASGAALFSPEAENELTVAMPAEGKSHVHEL